MKKNERNFLLKIPRARIILSSIFCFNESLPLLVLVLQPNLNKLFSSTTSSFFGVRSRFGVVWFGLVVRFVAFVSSEAREPLFVLVLFLCPSLDPPWHLGKAGTACAHSTQSLDYSSTRKAAGVSSWDASIRRVIRWLFCFPTVEKIRMLCMRPFLGFGARLDVR